MVEKYLWQDNTTLLAVYDASDNLIERFNYADGRLPISMLRGGSTYYMMYDQVGSLRLVVDTSGNTTKRMDYDSFGNIINDTNSGFTIPFGFAGGLHDRDTGLVRFGARDYDPTTGHWTAKDPIDFAGGDVNLYGYVQNDPVNWIDPVGLIQFKIFGNTVDIRLSGTFLGFNPSWDFTGFNKSNFNVNAVFPPLTAGFGLDIKINPPEECSRKKFISPFIGSRHLSIGTNVTYDENTQNLDIQGVNFSIGFSIGTPFGVTVPIN